MRKLKSLGVVALAAATALAMTACGGSDKGASAGASGAATTGGTTTIVIGASSTPHAVILQYIQDNLAKEAGINLDIKVYDDYVLPNRALSEGDLDANYFQHIPYFDAQVSELGYKFSHYEGVHIEPIGIYSKKVTDVKAVADGGKVGVTNDPSNQARGLALLAKAGLITLADGADPVTATLKDVKDNPKKLQFVELDAAQIPRSLDDLDIAVVNGNFALEAGLKPSKDALFLESGEGNPYANIVAVRTEDKDKPALKKLDELTHSQKVADFIKSQWPDGEVIPAF